MKQNETVKPKKANIFGKGTTHWTQQKPGDVFALFGLVMYNSEKAKKRYTFNVNPENVHLPRGQRLRFQLINSKFPAPSKTPVQVLVVGMNLPFQYLGRKFSSH